MAKAITAMLIGIAVSEGRIKDRRSQPLLETVGTVQRRQLRSLPHIANRSSNGRVDRSNLQ
jgi:hypothetical protein